ncbi:Anaphase-promoting complex subunit 1 [Thecaphora frezii]
MPPSTAELASSRLAQAQETRDAAHLQHALDRDIARALAKSSSSLIHRLRRVRAEAKLATEGSFIDDCARTPAPLSRPFQPHPRAAAALDELYWRDSVLTWSRGCSVVRSFVFNQPILQAFWTWMDVESPDPIDHPPGKRTNQNTPTAVESADEQASRSLLQNRGAFSALQRNHRATHLSADRGRHRVSHEAEASVVERALCVVFQQGILVQLPNRGEEYQIDLPFRPARAFPMPIGLFILRQTENEDVEIADRLQRHSRRFAQEESSGGIGYPFPEVAASMPYPQTPDLGPIELLSDGGQEDDEGEPPSNILPMAFHLRCPFDELAQVDRYSQISESLPGANGRIDNHVVHGPATPFTEVDETIVFVSPCDEQSPYPVLVTASHRSGSIRIYAFSATSTKPVATSMILSSRLPTAAQGSSSFLGSQFADAGATTSGRESSVADNLAAQESDETCNNDPQSSSMWTLGRGLPSSRKSGRVELERRSSTKSVPMGRDPSGRSRRISAMHAGNNERRMVSRVEDVASLARDRTMNGNISQTVDGLRRQSQALTQEAMLGELAPGNASVRIASTARLRRSSHAVRTPYAGPRTAPRQPGTAARTPAASRTHLSMSMPRPDASLDNFNLTSYPGGGPSAGKLGAYDHEGMEPNDSVSRSDDAVDVLSGLADLDSFARGFAAVALLEEVRVPEIRSSEDAQRVEVTAARFSESQNGVVHLYVCVPSAQKTFCRQVQYRTYAAEAGRLRRALHSSKPDASSAFAELDTPNVAVLPSPAGAASSGMVVVEPDSVLTLWIGPAGRSSVPLKLGSWRRWSSERQSPDEDTLALTSAICRISPLPGSGLQLQFVDRPEKARIELDFAPRCPLTMRALQLFSAVLPSATFANLQAAWITHRFGLDKPYEQKEPVVPDQDWSVLVRLLVGQPAPDPQRHGAAANSSFARLVTSLSHAEAVHDGIFGARWKDLPPQLGQDAAAKPTPAAVALSSYDCRVVAACLHLLAQESRLDSAAATSDLPRLVGLVFKVASRCGLDSWLHYWTRICPEASLGRCGPADKQTSDPRAEAAAAPFDIYDVLARQARGKSKATIADLVRVMVRVSVTLAMQEVLLRVCSRTSQLLELYSLFAPAQNLPKEARLSGTPTAAATTAHLVVERMVKLGIGPEALRTLPPGLALPLMEAIRSSQLDPPIRWSAAAYSLIHRADLAMHTLGSSAGYSTDLEQTVASAFQRTMPKHVQLDPLCAQIFNRDFRLTDVVKMLETTKLNTVYVPESENQSEAAMMEQHTRAVAAMTERTKAIPVGRAMLFMASRPFHVTRTWQIPHLCLGVKVVPRGVLVEPDAKADAASLEWPEFHNGVASILEISVARRSRIDSKWIFSHLGEEPTAKHAGFLFGLGLTKHLPALTPVHVFRYLKTRHNLLTIGFLLGLAAAAVGTGDPTARHLLGMQLVAFLPSGSAPLNLSIMTQTAGLLAMGLVFLGSNHRWTANRMLQQIGAAESPISGVQSQYREAYSLSAGLALGLVMLGKGRVDTMTSLPDKRMVAKLEQLINGSLSDLRRSRWKPGAAAIELSPDLSLTSIPASVALGLVFLRSNRADMAEILWVPSTDGMLDYIRPDVLLVRVLARYLILWDEIRCTAEWIDSVLPEWMRQHRRKEGEELSEAAQLASINMRAGACFAMGLKHAGSHDGAARRCLLQQLVQLDHDCRIKPVTYFSKIRQSALRAAADLVAVSLAAVMAGSGDLEVLRMLRMAHGDLESERSYGSHMATHMAIGLLFLGGGRLTLGSSDSAIAALLIALFPRFPDSSTDNRAHLQAFRHLWVLAVEPRLLIAKDIETGEVARVPMRLRTHNANEASQTATSLSARTFSPFLLPSLDKTAGIQTETARYWPASLHVSDSLKHAETLLHSRIVHVQRKTGHLSYLDDPHGSRSIFSRSLGTAPLDLGGGAAVGLGPSMEELRELVQGFSAAGKYEELVERLCAGPVGVATATQDAVDATSELQALMRTLVMECLTLDKAYAVPTYMALALAAKLDPADGSRAVGTLLDLAFADEFYESCFERLAYTPSQLGQAAEQGAASATAIRAPLIQRGLLCKLLYTARQKGRKAFEARADVQRAFGAYLGRLDPPSTTDMSSSRASVDGTGGMEAQKVLAFIWAAESLGGSEGETLRQLWGLVRQTAGEVSQTMDKVGEEERKAVVEWLVTMAEATVDKVRSHDHQQQQQQGKREAECEAEVGQVGSGFWIGKTVEAAVEEMLR